MFYFLIVIILSSCSIQRGSRSTGATHNNEPSIESKVKQDFTMDELQAQGNISIDLDKSVYYHEDRIGITITNHTDKTLSFGSMIGIQKYENQEWYSVTLSNLGFNAIGYKLKPNGQHHEDIVILKWLPSGKYRIIKEIQLGEDAKSPKIHLISGEFTLN